MYANVRASDYLAKPEYLKGVERVSMDYRELLDLHPDAIQILDPPYLSTDTANYEGYWGLTECLEVLEYCIRPSTYFTSSKSEIVTLLKWANKQGANFIFTEIGKRKSVNGKGAAYTDTMLVFSPLEKCALLY